VRAVRGEPLLHLLPLQQAVQARAYPTRASAEQPCCQAIPLRTLRLQGTVNFLKAIRLLKKNSSVFSQKMRNVSYCRSIKGCIFSKFKLTLSHSVADPQHFAGSGSGILDVDPDPRLRKWAFKLNFLV
jgi:hypothetical protein